MQYKAIPILLKHASLFRRPKWKTDPNWKEDKDTFEDWYNKVGWMNHDKPVRGYPEELPNRMPAEEFYSLLNKYKTDYDPAEDDISALRRKHIKQILALLKKKQRFGVGPEAYKYWMNREPFKALDDIDYIMDGYEHDDLGNMPIPVIFGEDAPYADLLKLRQRQGEAEDRALGYEPGWTDRILGKDENE